MSKDELDLDKIRKKIVKLFALAKSPNPNEAALALSMAQEMVEKFNIAQESIIDLEAELEISEEKTKRHGGEKPPAYESILIRNIAESFGCKRIHLSSWGTGRLINFWKFIGIKHKAEIASFFATVLLRKCKSARQEFIKSLTRTKKREVKIIRADRYCLGWVSIVCEKLKDFTGTSKEKELVDRYMKRYNDKLEPLNSILRKPEQKHNWVDYYRGRAIGQGVEVQHGVSGSQSPVMLLNN